MPGFALSRLLGAAVLAQAVLSAGNLLLGLMLIRFSTEEDYGRYVLAYTLLMLAVAVPSSAVFGPQAVVGGKLDTLERSRLVSGVGRALARWVGAAAPAVVIVSLALATGGALAWADALLGAALVIAAAAAIGREFFRQSLFLEQAPQQVLRHDGLFVALSLTGAALAVAALAGAAAPGVMLALGGAAGLAALPAYRALEARLGWPPDGGEPVLGRLWPLGRWALLGSMINWSFVQGFYFVMVAVLDVRAVAAVAATRLLLMPINLLAGGVGQMLLPLATGWYRSHGGRAVLQRLGGIALALFVGTLAYTAVLWWLRDWIMGGILGRTFEDQDRLIALWALFFALMVVRTALSRAPMVIERFKPLAGMEAATALTSLTLGFVAMQALGAAGGVLGLIAGEVLGLILLGGYLARLRRAGAL